MNYKLLFIDVDGTLKQEPHPISKANKEAILTALKAGKIISIASGRNRDMILRIVKELRLDEYGTSYTIALNGAHIIENNTTKTLHKVPISMENTRYLFEKTYELGISCHAYTEGPAYFNFLSRQYYWYANEGCDSRLVDMKHKILGMSSEPLKFIMYSDDRDKLEKLKEQAHPVVSSELNAEFSSKLFLEYTSVKAGKGPGMEFICNLYNIPLSMAMAAGDGENDISMIKMAGLGVAMKNSPDNVKAAADVVTKKACLEDGLAEIIYEYLLK
jgi:Cof subfamily protein (haloacid dehalogenase superfamily)